MQGFLDPCLKWSIELLRLAHKMDAELLRLAIVMRCRVSQTYI